MSGRMKELPTSRTQYIEVVVGIPGRKRSTYRIPNTPVAKEQLANFLQKMTDDNVSPWEEAIPWRTLAEERIVRHTEEGLVLRGARYRAGISQKELSKRCGISQENLSRMENGKRAIGVKVAKKLAKILSVDYKLLTSPRKRKR